MRCLIITGKEEKEFMNKVAVLDCTLRDDAGKRNTVLRHFADDDEKQVENYV